MAEDEFREWSDIDLDEIIDLSLGLFMLAQLG